MIATGFVNNHVVGCNNYRDARRGHHRSAAAKTLIQGGDISVDSLLFEVIVDPLRVLQDYLIIMGEHTSLF